MTLPKRLNAALLLFWIACGQPGLQAQVGSYCLTTEQRNYVLVRLLELDTLKLVVVPKMDSALVYYQAALEASQQATMSTQAALEASQQQVATCSQGSRLAQQRVTDLESQVKRGKWQRVKTLTVTALASLAAGLVAGIFVL